MSDQADALLREHGGLVHSLCRRFTGRGIEYDDLYGAGCLGLVKAWRGFDASRGLQFSTYAVPVILGEVKHLFRDGGTVRVSRGLKERAAFVTKMREDFITRQNRDPTISELRELCGLTSEDLTEALAAFLPVFSLTSGENESQLDLPTESCEENIVDRVSLREAVDRLPERQRDLMRLRYFSHKTQTQTAAVLGLTQVQVSRGEKAALSQLREIMSAAAK